MNQTVQIQFADKMVSFDTFLSAIRNVVQEEISKAVGKRPFITQAKAFDTFGRRNVERWVKEGKVKVFGRGKNGKITRYEYRLSELEACACKFQDYLHPT